MLINALGTGLESGLEKVYWGKEMCVRGLVLHYVLVVPVLPAVFLDDIFCDASSECAGMTFGLTDFTTKMFSTAQQMAVVSHC